jgi:hypothetical protein
VTKILSETKTYTPKGGDMVHTGYFIVTDNYPLKQTLKGPWEDMKQRPTFKLRLDRIIAGLQDA